MKRKVTERETKPQERQVMRNATAHHPLTCPSQFPSSDRPLPTNSPTFLYQAWCPV